MPRNIIIIFAFLSASCAQTWNNPVIEEFALVRNSSAESEVFYPNSETIGFRLVVSDDDDDLAKVVIKKYQDTGSGFGSGTLLSTGEYSMTGSGSVVLQNNSIDTSGAVTGTYYYEAIPSDSDGNTAQSWTLQASVVEEPAITSSDAAYDFGNTTGVGSTSSAHVFTITNATTSSKVAFGTITITGTDASEFEITSDLLSGTVVDAGSSNTVSVVLSPTSSGSKTAALNIPYGHLDTPYLQITLSATVP